MKRHTQTPVLKIKNTAKKVTLVTVAVLLAVTTTFQASTLVKADDFDRRIAEIQSQINQYQAEAGKLASQAESFQKEMDALTAQKNVIQGQINLKQAEYDKLVNDIAANEKKIID